MIAVSVLAALLLLCATIWPDLPLSVGIVRACMSVGRTVTEHATVGRALIGVSIALALFAVIWALQGDAPMVLTLALPELAAWFTTFEIATLVDALIGIGTVWMTVRASGVVAAMKSRPRHSRQRRSKSATRSAANDDAEPEPRAVAA